MKTLDEALDYFASDDGVSPKPEWRAYNQTLDEVADSEKVRQLAVAILAYDMPHPLRALRKAIAIGIMVGIEMEKHV